MSMGTDPMSTDCSIDPLLPADRSIEPDVAALYLQHRARLIGLASAITLDRGLAEDIVHEAFAGLQRHGARINNPIGYLQRSVVNLGINVMRRRTVAARHPIPPPPLASTQEIDETWATVAALPARQRAVIVLRFWEDMTIDAIATVLQWPAGSVKSTLSRALVHLKKELS